MVAPILAATVFARREEGHENFGMLLSDSTNRVVNCLAVKRDCVSEIFTPNPLSFVLLSISTRISSESVN